MEKWLNKPLFYKHMNIKNIGIASIVTTLMLSGIAFAAQTETVPTETQQPYVVANRPADGTISFDVSGTAIVSEAFVVAQQIPVHASAITYSNKVVARTMYVDSTGYNSEERQTDSTPFITANGEHVYWGGVAANFLPFGTKIKIPDYYGDQIFTVNDRMNKRYYERVDVWFPERPQAIKWGVRKIKIEILG